MPRTMEPREALVITNPNKGLVVNQLDKLLTEWKMWLKIAQELSGGPDSSDYHPNTCTEAIKDGFENRRKHETLREKTLVFIGNNFSGYGFLFENWPTHPHEANTVRLIGIVPGWIHRLETLSACIEYARVTDGFWKAKGKELVEQVVKTTPEKAAEIAASYLKNPASPF
jgi:hypothetical protein